MPPERNKNFWTNKKYGKRQYKGTYEKATPKSERELVLTSIPGTGRHHRYVAESHQAAKDLGYKITICNTPSKPVKKKK